MSKEKRIPSRENMNNMVRQSLETTGKMMLDLASRIGDGEGHISETERKMVRMAMIPALEETFSEFIHFYILDLEEPRGEAFHQLDRIAGMRF